MSKIHAFKSSSIINYIQDDLELICSYSSWMSAAGKLPEEHSVKTAKRVLGKQDYCWQGWYRNWVWEDAYIVDEKECRWRFFASKRGLHLEVEVFDDYDMLHVSRHILEKFIKEWKSKDALYDYEREKRSLEIRRRAYGNTLQ